MEKGNAACTEANGVKNGLVSEWVKESGLSSTRPADPAEKAGTEEQLVAHSDDFRRYHAVFAKAARDLIGSGRCTVIDFEEQGGWLTDPEEMKDPVYFVHCGGVTRANLVYLNAATGRTY